MRNPLATLAALSLLLAAASARAEPLSNLDRLPAAPAEAPRDQPAPGTSPLRPLGLPVLRVPEPGTNLARSAALGAQVPVPPAEPATAVPAGSVRTAATRGANGTPAHTSQAAAVPFKLLYAPAADDNPTYRAEIAALTGGTVDYYDARNGTPSLALLQTYQSVYTWPNTAYGSASSMGDRLADYVDAGGKVILGVFCTYTTGSASLSGRIMTAAYAPVRSPAGTNHLSLSTYAGDGTSALHAGVLACQASFRDVLVLQGSGNAAGHYADGEILAAWRPDGRVVYVNGGGGPLGSGDWARLIANAWIGIPTAKSVLFAPSAGGDADFRAAIGGFTLGPVNYFDARTATPSPPMLATYDCVFTFASQPYSDSIVFGDRLADFVDAGGRVILGPFSTNTSGNHLAGRIMTPAYSPVSSPVGAAHVQLSPWLGDGASCLTTGVTSFAATNRDRLVIQGAGIADGHFADGEIACAFRPDGQVVYCNGVAGAAYPSTGDGARIVASAATCQLATGPRVLYAPADFDDPSLRAVLSKYTGGPVDYYDARTSPPALTLLQTYACVYTWANYPYGDPIGFGNTLANYVDRGGRVVLGPYCTYTSGNALGGAIMGTGYAPVVSPNGSIRATLSAYAGDGTTRLLHGVAGFDCSVRDSLAPLGPGVVDAFYADGEIAVAYRPDRRVIYLNGGLLTGTGDWPILHRNAFLAPVPSGLLYATTADGQLITVDVKSGAGTPVATLPSPGANELEIDPLTGQSFYQLAEGTPAAQQIFFRTGTGIGPAVPNGGSYAGLEYALGRLYGTAHTTPCGNSELRILNPWSGVSTLVGSTGIGPVSGLAYEPRTSALYGVLADCAPPGQLYRIDLTSGASTPIGPPTVVGLGSLEFGPDGDLYGGGAVAPNEGNLFRINPTTGKVKLVGATGFGALTGLAFATPNVAGVPAPANPALRLTAAPNPSRGRTVRITFTLPRAGDAALEVFDIAGRSVWRRAWTALPAGDQAVTWNGLGPDGRRVAGGIYLARLVTPAGIHSTRIVQLD